MIVTERKTDIFERRAGGKGNTIMMKRFTAAK